MNEDPTIPIGTATQAGRSANAPTPAGAASWGSFTLLARVGHGGFGEVYRAWDPHLQREVALKLLLPGAVAGEAEYAAMLREARALASVRHPNIVPVHGIDRHDGRVGFWTDFVRGKTLSILVAEQGTFGAREAALIGLDVARALSAVHRAGLLHRDIKAENVMREEGGRILLMDFGLSSLEQRQTDIAGTPNYMAPELFEGGRATVATDMYAMGVLLYFLVAGDYPVHLGGLSTRDAIEAFPRRKALMDLRPDLPESLLRTVSTATEVDPGKRFQSAGQLANALAESLGTHAPAEVASPPAPQRPRKRAAPWIMAGLLSLAVLLAAGLVWYGKLQRQTHRDNSSDSTSATADGDEFQKAQDALQHSYKEAALAEAVKGFQAVLQADPQNALAKARLGAAYWAQHSYSSDPKHLELARKASADAIKMNSDLAAPHITLAQIAAFNGQSDLAMQEIEIARKKEPRRAEVYGARGEVYESQHRSDEAIKDYNHAITLDPGDWRWPMSLGVAEYKMGNMAEAIKQWQNATALAQDNAVAFYDLSLAHRRIGEFQQAQTEMEQAIKLDPTARKYAALGSVLMLQGKYDQAAEMERKAIALDPRNYVAYENLGAAYLWSGRNRDKAIDAFRKAVQIEEAEHAEKTKDPWALAMLAEGYGVLGDSARSMVLARQALALEPDDPAVNYKIGSVFELLGQRGEAIPLIARALANGYNPYEFEHDPGLAGLRGDPKFASALSEQKQKNK